MFHLKYLVALAAIIAFSCANPLSSDESQQVENHTTLTSISSEIKEVCQRGCPRILDPICAVDQSNPKIFKYFHNQCLMDFESCRMEKAWKPTEMIACIKDVEPVIRDDCLRGCPFIYNPVCASNGDNFEVFGNECVFGMENCLASGQWLLAENHDCGL